MRCPARADRRVEFIRESVAELRARSRARGGGAHRPARGRPREIPALAAGTRRRRRLRQPGLRAGGAASATPPSRTRSPPAASRFTRARTTSSSRGTRSSRRRASLLGVHALQERLAREADDFYLSSVPGRRAAPAARAPPADLDGADPVARVPGLRAHRPARAAACAGNVRRRGALRGFRERIDALPATRATFRPSRGLVPVRPPPLRHGLHPRARRVRALRCAASATAGAATWLSELDLARLLLPDPVAPPARGRAARSSRSTTRLAFPERSGHFAAWCEGRTGYPHRRRGDAPDQRDRLHAQPAAHDRRVVPREGPARRLALGRAILRRHLIDFDLASNNGGWQWAASTGCDAQPYFRIFNPVTQSERFDPTASSSAATCRNSRRSMRRRSTRRGRMPPRSSRRGRGDRPRLSGARRRPRRSAPGRAGAVQARVAGARRHPDTGRRRGRAPPNPVGARAAFMPGSHRHRRKPMTPFAARAGAWLVVAIVLAFFFAFTAAPARRSAASMSARPTPRCSTKPPR